ncbi:bifunctional glutamate N-acetyltransferase/amino-acid acetyltransferase ArgJ [Staphylococcus simiae]|uniref:bifunctional glutamate N-acetyltransferase/amino-acid acetyltransferase ArgJ n=1 Tax=Staphylococcus simiae TaxID=308354 RepID=UPI001A967588|nr:bifunctional glutamate N-acetyltransferase/amino-acid acetyltransferase ArgJ [Staphylococcus simiae]MBO1198878.1 bifunctional glutamate N-acetyltransferase/amino-acid acetyltransferase ArgJ [Staphylococcus simiae]MBO1201096.1 bifunctional glutamate N-acetyltransferase/amino-acid acetyltransferase ArgJ [Staphylococcus simiae]MBO1203278.1 bifunctional glutamate N-acetyltransferase/amino-acid acetyltransferase ArgJ [Staphylococcus simiae]MBO1210773.1 bifunctional glutamate N-acetyltransferase/a
MIQHETTQQFTIINQGDISTPQGFIAGGMHIGLRANKKDFAWLYSTKLASAAAVYTLNQFKAAPLIVTEETLKQSSGKLQALVVNSANANSCTGQQGINDAKQTQAWAAQQLHIDPKHVAVTSTGVIGEYLPMDKIKYGTKHILDTQYSVPNAFNEAILTTDTCTKHTAVTLTIDGHTITIGGSAKGSGMIHPNMATMLVFITTDANIANDDLTTLLKSTTNHTFNMITVDGDTSTNDMALVMANGCAHQTPLTPQHPQWMTFVTAFNYVCNYLAQAIARDGEGATKLITANVNGASSVSDAKVVAKSIVGSNLVKAAIFGQDANFGRIITAIGYTNCDIQPNQTSIKLNGIAVVKHGMAVSFNEDEMSQTLKHNDITIDVDLGVGNNEATAYGCDLSYDYVRINASYRT